MTLDASFVLGFAVVFARMSAMLLSSPLFGAMVPVQLRIMFTAIISLALTPSLMPYLTLEFAGIPGLLLILGKEVLIGLLIGGMMQFLLAGVQMGGSFLDLSLGIGAAQIFNPLTGSQNTPIGRYKFLLGLVLLLILNGHHLMFQAFLASYEVAGPTLASLDYVREQGLEFMGMLMLLAVQIAFPAAAVATAIDFASGIINKAVPQTMPFLIAIPVKLTVGVLILSISLPVLATIVNLGVGETLDTIRNILGA